MKDSKRLIILSLFVTQALVLSIIESWLPIPAVVPGVKLGLANIITMVVIIFMGPLDAFMVVIARCILASIFTGGLTVLLFSLTGGFLSTAVMSLLYRFLAKGLSIVGISTAGAIAHNVGQLIVAGILMKELAVFGYMPALLISGTVAGIFIGLCVSFTATLLRKTHLF